MFGFENECPVSKDFYIPKNMEAEKYDFCVTSKFNTPAVIEMLFSLTYGSKAFVKRITKRSLNINSILCLRIEWPCSSDHTIYLS